MRESKRDEVLNQLALFLKNRNKKSWFEFLNSPFFIMLIGGVLLTFLTMHLENKQHENSLEQEFQRARLNQKFSLLKIVPLHYNTSCSHLNDSFFYLVRYCKVNAKEDINDDQKNNWLNYLKEKYEKAAENYRKVEPIVGVISQVEVMFDTNKAQTSAKEFKQKWLSFESYVNAAGEKLNSNKFSSNDFEDWEKSRLEMTNELDKLHNILISSMGDELTKAYHVVDTK